MYVALTIKSKLKSTILTGAVVASLVLSLFLTSVVSAQGAAPTTTPTPTQAAPKADGDITIPEVPDPYQDCGSGGSKVDKKKSATTNVS
jgi:hypothetical protein